MIIPVLILAVIFLLVLGGGATIWLVFKHRQALKKAEPTKETAKTLTFHWRYIIMPLAILLVSIILTACFYHQLPTEVAYKFNPDGSPDKWLSREMIIAWMLAPQVLLTLIAVAIAWGVTRLGILSRPTEGIISLMGNMIALPQAILGFAMLDIFSYNAYQVHIMPIWLFALIIMGVGGVIIGIYFIRIIRQVWVSSQ
ncbi:DUF1648 domain-containing protein [Chloroflexota bacterium]